MAAQTNYGYSTPKGVAGGKVNLFHDEVITRQNEAQDGVLKYGMAVKVGTVPGSNVTVPNAGTTKEQIEGVVLAHPNTEQDMKGKVVVKNGTSLSVMTKGCVWGRLATGATATYGNVAYVVVTGDDAGTFTDKADGAVDIGAKFGKDTDDGIAVIVLN